MSSLEVSGLPAHARVEPNPLASEHNGAGRRRRSVLWSRPLLTPLFPQDGFEEAIWLEPPAPLRLPQHPPVTADASNSFSNSSRSSSEPASADPRPRPPAEGAGVGPTQWDQNAPPSTASPGRQPKGTEGSGAPAVHLAASGPGRGGWQDLEALLAAAESQPLSEEKLKDLLHFIKSDEGTAVMGSLIPPSTIPNLVNQNPALASNLLQLLYDPAGKNYSLFESELLSMDLSVNSLEVVNSLLPVLDSPSDFALELISRAISKCQSMKDKYAQNRQVKLLCIFIQAQLRSKLIHVQDIFVEVQAFCIEFSRIKDAAALFKLLKNLDNE